jgi:hypothetical protein
MILIRLTSCCMALALGASATASQSSLTLVSPSTEGESTAQANDRGMLGVSLGGGEGAALIQATLPRSPAQGVGLLAGDRITAVNGTEILSSKDLVTAVGRFAPGEVITLSVDRQGWRKDLEVTLASRSQAALSSLITQDSEEAVKVHKIERRVVLGAQQEDARAGAIHKIKVSDLGKRGVWLETDEHHGGEHSDAEIECEVEIEGDREQGEHCIKALIRLEDLGDLQNIDLHEILGNLDLDSDMEEVLHLAHRGEGRAIFDIVIDGEDFSHSWSWNSATDDCCDGAEADCEEPSEERPHRHAGGGHGGESPHPDFGGAHGEHGERHYFFSDKTPHDASHGQGGDLHAELGSLRREVHALRQEMHEIRKRLGTGPPNNRANSRRSMP